MSNDRGIDRPEGSGRSSGFTLVEMLVTLVLLSMVVAIVLGSLRQVLDARTRLRPYLEQSEQTMLVAGWFRQTVQGLMPDYDKGSHRFTATTSGFSGLTLAPLAGPPGTPTVFEWSLAYDAVNDVTTLEYREQNAKAVRVAAWSGREGAFSYYDEKHAWGSRWEPPDTADKSQTVPQLPALIRLGNLAAEVFPTIVAAPRATPFPRPLPAEMLGSSLSQN
jgi:prepilin-type N-terminal cleavage/methylation domain-containing protein